MFNVETLVVTMQQTDHGLLTKMNIQTDAIIGNQCDENRIEKFEYRGYNIRWLSFNERGVGLNRNNTLMRSKADICVLADDDMVYYDDYPQLVQQAFMEYPAADMIIFNIDEPVKNRHINTRAVKVNKFNFGRYGAARLAFKRESIFLNGISFNLMFGGGTKYNAGEDCLFIKACLDKGLTIIAVPYSIAKLTNDRKSTWFIGYDEKYFWDKGVLNYFLNKRFAKILCLYHVLKHKKLYATFGLRKAYKYMSQGVKSVKGR